MKLAAQLVPKRLASLSYFTASEKAKTSYIKTPQEFLNFALSSSVYYFSACLSLCQ